MKHINKIAPIITTPIKVYCSAWFFLAIYNIMSEK